MSAMSFLLIQLEPSNQFRRRNSKVLNPRDFETELFRLGPTIVTEFFISKFPILLVNHFFTSQEILDFRNVAIGSTSTKLEGTEIVELNSIFRGEDFGNGKMLVVDSGSTTSRVLDRVENEGSHFGFLGALFGSPYTMKILYFDEQEKTNFSSNPKRQVEKRKWTRRSKFLARAIAIA